AGYVVVQLLGAGLAASVHRLFLPEAGAATMYGLTLPSAAIGESQMLTFAIEATLTFFLVFSIFGTVVSGKAPQGFHGIAIGFTLVTAILVGGPLTGASLNPARTFGPAIVAMNFTAHWAYWLGPIVGALLAALLYRYALMSGEKQTEAPKEASEE
ncbi:MAG: MIP/aquaporin family protein, partial [Nitrososphaerales archaeon]